MCGSYSRGLLGCILFCEDRALTPQQRECDVVTRGRAALVACQVRSWSLLAVSGVVGGYSLYVFGERSSRALSIGGRGASRGVVYVWVTAQGGEYAREGIGGRYLWVLKHWGQSSSVYR